MKRIIICLLAVALALFFSVRHTIGKEISNNMAIEEYFTIGYENASFDYFMGARYHSTITGEYDNLLAQYKLAYDAGYGFGWSDAETDLYDHSGLGSKYICRSPYWMYEIYYLFK